MMGGVDLDIRVLPIGAEILGLDAGREHDPHIRDALYRAWLEHGILLFKGIDSIARHLDISRCFGELEIHPFPAVRSPLNPLLIELGGKKRARAYVFDGDQIRINRIGWHRDTAYTPDVCKGAMLRMVHVPRTEGETLFADTAKAYDDLPADVKVRLEGLEYRASLRLDPVAQTRPGAFWATARPASQAEDPDGPPADAFSAGGQANYPPVVHPVVLTHPESGRKCIFISPTYVDHFLGMDPAESDALHRYLVAHMVRPQYVYQHRWSPDEAIVWDNRRFLHAARGNLLSESRWGLRTTLAGALRTGRYFEEAAIKQTSEIAD
jgi:taurine dioxygenase